MMTRFTRLALTALLSTLPLMTMACGSRAASDDTTSTGDIPSGDPSDATSAQGSTAGDDATVESSDDAIGDPSDTTSTTPSDDLGSNEPAVCPPWCGDADDEGGSSTEDDATTGPTESDIEAPTCTPTCDGKACGDDGCGGSCGTCADGEACTVEGACAALCIPDCGDMTCGDDGCGGSCGACADDETCAEGVCLADCVPACNAANCGDDGCGGTCGECTGDETCTDGMCMAESNGACDNAEDLAVISTADVAQLSQDAAFACLQGFSVDLQCAIDEIADATGMTTECAACFGEQAVCVASNCAFQCFDPGSQSCNDCRNANCTPLFEPCAGIEPIQ
jgi:hypothetical protein